MDEFDHSAGSGEEIGLGGILTYLLVLTLCLATSLVCLSDIASIGPDVGEMVTFDPRKGPKYWEQPGLAAQRANPTGTKGSNCILMPSVMSAGGGSPLAQAQGID